jgi:hypothetical protein
MTAFFLESEASRKARLEFETKVGARAFFDALQRLSSGKHIGRYASEDSEARETIARSVYRVLSTDVETALLAYETEYTQVLEGRAKLQFKDKKRCSVCGRANEGAYDICPVCLATYHEGFRSEFLLTLNSCDALRIVDAR